MAALTHSGWGHDVGAAEDDDDPYCRPETAGAEPDDAVDDANDVCLSYFILSQWVGSLLGGFDQYQNCYAVFCYRVGRFGSNRGWEEGYQR